MQIIISILIYPLHNRNKTIPFTMSYKRHPFTVRPMSDERTANVERAYNQRRTVVRRWSDGKQNKL
jgi:hypothetical protein